MWQQSSQTCLPTRTSSFQTGSNSCTEYAPRCSTVAHHLRGRSQSSQILRVKRAQGGCDSGPDSKRFVLRRLGRAARSKARREQIIGDGEPPPGSRGEPGSTIPSVPLRPAHSHGVAFTRNVTVVFLHPPVESTSVWHWMWFFVAGIAMIPSDWNVRPTFHNPGSPDSGYSAQQP
jgi:hypothetical protein